jgi:cytoskeletal protein RodZ
MKHPWLAYVIVGLLAAGAGVAIAGLPDNSPVAATITAPTTEVVDDTLPDPTTPDTTAPDTTTPDTAATTTQPESTTPGTTTPETTEPVTTESVPADLPDRSELNVVAANGANVAGTAVRMATLLEGLGYVDVTPVNGSEIVELTAVYYTDGFADSALRLADDLDIPDVLVGSIENAPPVAGLPETAQLLVYVGIDRA